ncbi:hypothetical protein BU24DRAFT_429067 [Aaosphaeria arxii CBS 175.79]|uniref:Transcriptional activator of proteases prtT n=1 Tax=Aaosphaeria arxii CBS 175.79 TaxID=1450172 RepID=A0A6A5X769_9PLEO|nr:uncharacterized protein BU24DRAFT_429067 [Aaosphaeria arxii CBS 175.79]KAF2008761.1 hypothetical protein BU24DRAFT_429067 [Aaosphaeria arxii CBS 175.79]
MPSVKKRVMSCSTCRRLKTRCEVKPGARICTRCETLRLPCALPVLPVDPVGENSERTQERNSEHCNCDQRLASIESSLDEIKQHLRMQQPGLTVRQPPSSQWSPQASNNDSTCKESTSPAVTDNNIWAPLSMPKDAEQERVSIGISHSNQLAPIKVIRRLNKMITGDHPTFPQQNIIEELWAIGIDPDGLGTLLFKGFERMTATLPFISLDLADIKENHQLLFATCLLAGFQTIPSLLHSQLHISLNTLVRDQLSKVVLNTPIDIPTLNIMLILSAWNLGLEFRGQYIDSWLMTGSVILHLIITCNIDKLSAASDPHGTSQSEELRAWIAACLLHLKFAIGTGRPLAAERTSMEQLLIISERLPSTDPMNSLLLELKLYLKLHECVILQTIPTQETWDAIQSWCEPFVKNPNTNNQTLQVAYLSITLILARWELSQLSEPHESVDPESHSATQQRTTALIDLSLTRSQDLLNILSNLYVSTCQAKLVFDFLLGAYAAVTIVEYSHHLTSTQATFSLMDRIIERERLQFRTIEPVLQWATDVMRKKAMDEVQSAQGQEQDMTGMEVVYGQQGGGAQQMSWVPGVLVESMFSFEEEGLGTNMGGGTM